LHGKRSDCSRIRHDANGTGADINEGAHQFSKQSGKKDTQTRSKLKAAAFFRSTFHPMPSCVTS
jgi:hypothetical protein